MNSKRLRAAYHEAGHAVIGVKYGLRFKHASIAPQSDSLGRVLFERFGSRFRPDIMITLRGAEIIEAHAVCSYAGAAAAGLLSGKDFDWTGADEDRSSAQNLLSYVEEESDALGAYLALMRYRARNMVRARKTAVSKVANKLIEKETLTFSEIRDLLQPPWMPQWSPRKG